MEKQDIKKNIIRRLIAVILNLIIQLILLFLAAGTLLWTWAWIFLIVSCLVILINMFVLSPELIAERGKVKKDAKKWDKRLTAGTIIPFFLLFLFAGLDHRYGWSGNLMPELKIAGMTVYFFGNMLITWSMLSNKYFSTLVRLQTDRDHTVASGGPYRYVRHPGYVGIIIMHISIPFAFGSLWALIFSGILAVLYILRTYLEDETLKKELPGYVEYAQKTRYRLIPFVW
jgi:protein-S-isoprenylcysteine O-methyltransferase Ste14